MFGFSLVFQYTLASILFTSGSGSLTSMFSIMFQSVLWQKSCMLCFDFNEYWIQSVTGTCRLLIFVDLIMPKVILVYISYEIFLDRNVMWLWTIIVILSSSPRENGVFSIVITCTLYIYYQFFFRKSWMLIVGVYMKYTWAQNSKNKRELRELVLGENWSLTSIFNMKCQISMPAI